MKSPFTGGGVKLEKEVREFEYRKELFSVLFRFYVCIDTGEQFTTTAIDILNVNQIQHQYREKYG